MTDLRRWSEEDATTEELELLELAKGDKPSTASRARIVGALGVGAALATTTAAAASGGGISLAAKIAGAALILGAGTFGVYRYTHDEPVEPASVAVSVTASALPTREVVATAPKPTVESARPVESAKVEPRPRAVVSAPVSSGSLAKELAALERARKALATESPDRALAELDKYEKRFPKGELASERTVLQVQALLARGKRGEAVALANQFAAAHPDSPYARRVLALVNGPKPKR
jgi:hypothetical protein